MTIHETPKRARSDGPARVAGSLMDDASFSVERHELIAAAAERLLASKTLEAIAKIVRPLGEGTGLADIAGWADQIKRRKATATDDEETRDFLNDPRNANQETWHFVDIPAGAAGYDRAALAAFTRDDDVVQSLGEAIKVLRKTSTRLQRAERAASRRALCRRRPPALARRLLVSR